MPQHPYKIYDDSNYRDLVGDGTSIIAGGERRLLSATPKPVGHDSRKYSALFNASNVIPRSDWSAMIKDQKAKRKRVSDWQNFAPHDQNGLPTCWANGPAHAFTTIRVMNGLPLVYISACSLAVPISGGHSGGYEGDALEYLNKYGGVSQDLWPNNSTNRSFMNDSKCVEDRKFHMALMSFECNSFDEFATACLLGYPIAVAFNWWSHVISGGDLVEIESNSFGIMYRNNWGDWGDNNDYGQPGYVTMREGKGTPDSGFAIQLVTASTR